MKKIIVFTSIISTLFYSGCVPESKIDEQGRPVAVQKQTEKALSAAEKNCYYFEFNGLQVILKYVMFDGHEYVVARRNRSFGITHSPRCECKK